MIDDQKKLIADVWLSNQSAAVRAKFLSRWKVLRQTPVKDWRRDPYSDLRGDGDGLGEIRFFVDKVQHRPIGYHDRNTFVLVFFAIEKGDKFEPRNTVAVSQKRKKAILEDPKLKQEMNRGRLKLT